MSTGKVKKGRGRPLKIDEFILKVILDDQTALLSRVMYQFLRTAAMRQPTMYSYMASHCYLYQIVFTHLAHTQ